MPKTLQHLGLCKRIKQNEEEMGVNMTAAGKGIWVKRQQVKWVSRGEGWPCDLNFRPFITHMWAGQPCFQVNSVWVLRVCICWQIKPRDAISASSPSPDTCADGSEALEQTHHLKRIKCTCKKLCGCQLYVKRPLSKLPIFSNSCNQNSYTSTSCYAHNLQLPQNIFCCVSCL